MGPRIFVFFLVAAVLTGAVAIAVNINLEDSWNRALGPGSMDRD